MQINFVNKNSMNSYAKVLESLNQDEAIIQISTSNGKIEISARLLLMFCPFLSEIVNSIDRISLDIGKNQDLTLFSVIIPDVEVSAVTQLFKILTQGSTYCPEKELTGIINLRRCLKLNIRNFDIDTAKNANVDNVTPMVPETCTTNE